MSTFSAVVRLSSIAALATASGLSLPTTSSAGVGIGAPINAQRGASPHFSCGFPFAKHTSVAHRPASHAARVTSPSTSPLGYRSYSDPSISNPYDIVSGPDGALWFTNSGDNTIGRIATSGLITNFTASSVSEPAGIAVGPDGALWFTNFAGNSIGRITTSGVITDYTSSTISSPWGITLGPDGAMWFTNEGNDSIGRITTSGEITNYGSPEISSPAGIAAGSDGSLWFTNYCGNSVGEFVPSTDSFSSFSDSVLNEPDEITSGPDGNLWVSNAGGDTIERVSTTGTITDFSGTGVDDPGFITEDSDGELWFTSYDSDGVCSITTLGDITCYTDLNVAPYDPWGIAQGADGALWITGFGGDTIYRLGPQDTATEPADVSVMPENGALTVSWNTPSYTGTTPISGYEVSINPFYTDRLNSPTASSATFNLPADANQVQITHLVDDCHQMYQISVNAVNSWGSGDAYQSSPLRPSGVVPQDGAPTYVVILLDGIREFQRGFTVDPFKPTLDGDPSYCPESWNGGHGYEAEADYAGPPNGPWEFFNKWNFSAEMGDSTPRVLERAPRDKGFYTHQFMLDNIAGQGAVILPYSYGFPFASVSKGSNGQPSFTFPPYTECNSTPPPIAGPRCDDLSIGPIGNIDYSVSDDVAKLEDEVASVHRLWPSSKIVIIGHSQGGLIAWDWFLANRDAKSRLNVAALFSLDSPINGVTTPIPFGYPSFSISTLWTQDRNMLAVDKKSRGIFHFIGTFGDSPVINLPGITLHAYGDPYSNTVLEHQLLVVGPNCATQSNSSDCPAPLDHISGCRITASSKSWIIASSHFIVKFCPDDVEYVNQVLGLSYPPVVRFLRSGQGRPLLARQGHHL